MSFRFENPRARAAEEFVLRRLDQLKKTNAEKRVLRQLAEYPFKDYPDYTAPWHLLQYPNIRWAHLDVVISIINTLKQPTGGVVGEPIKLEPFQILILVCALGPERPNDKLRLVREVLLTIGRKNAKSATVAAIALAMMLLTKEYHGLVGQEIQVGAADKQQAGITFNMTSMFAIQDDTLGINDTFSMVPSQKRMKHRKTLTELRCLSSDAYRAHGGNPAFVLLDEIGNVPHQAAEDFYSVLTTGFGTQLEPMTWLFSTQAPNDQHFFSQMVDRVKRINEGFIKDDTLAGFVYTLPETNKDGEDIDPFDESLWYLANPGIDTICSREDIRDWARKAKELPSLENKFRNLKLNQRISAVSAFLSVSVWDRNKAEPPPIEQLKGCRVTLGLDLAETTDLCALVALFEPLDEGGPFGIYVDYWIPGEGLEARERSDKVPYSAWVRKGLINTESSHSVDYDLIADKIIWYYDNFEVAGLGYDRWRMKRMRQSLAAKKFARHDDDKFFVEIGQGFKDQSESVTLLETDALDGKLAHGNHEILKWNVANTVIVRDPANNRKFDKTKSYGRIDGCVALAIARHARQEILHREEDEEDYLVFNDFTRAVIM